MLFSKLAVSLLVSTAAILPSSNAFAPSSVSLLQQPSKSKCFRSTIRRSMSSQDNGMSEVEKLRAAAAKARGEAAKLAKEMGKDVDESGNVMTAAQTKLKESVSESEIEGLLTSSINFEDPATTTQITKLDELIDSGDLSLWKSASLKPYDVSLQFLDSRTGGKVTVESLGFGGEGDVSMDDFKYATLGVTLGASVLGVLALSFLPENIGATVCYIMALIPILFLAVGSTAPGIIAGAIQSAKGTSDSQEEQFDRICRHEAGHFLCGYLCGLPIKGYSTDDTGVQCVEFHPSQEGPVTGREFSMQEIAALTCVSMSGSVAEVLGLGNAKGGDNDLIQLDGFFRRSQEFIGAQKQQDLTRWGALASYNLINENRPKYNSLVDAFKVQKSVPECIAILESR